MHNFMLQALRNAIIITLNFDGERMQSCEVEISDGS